MFSKKIKVVDSNNTPLPGANISLGPGKGTITDFNGEATVVPQTLSSYIRISYIGFESKAFQFGTLPSTIVLQESNDVLDAVVIESTPKPTEVVVVASETGTPWYVWPGVVIALVGVAKMLAKPEKTTKAIGLGKGKKKAKKKKPSKSLKTKKAVKKPLKAIV